MGLFFVQFSFKRNQQITNSWWFYSKSIYYRFRFYPYHIIYGLGQSISDAVYTWTQRKRNKCVLFPLSHSYTKRQRLLTFFTLIHTLNAFSFRRNPRHPLMFTYSLIQRIILFFQQDYLYLACLIVREERWWKSNKQHLATCIFSLLLSSFESIKIFRYQIDWICSFGVIYFIISFVFSFLAKDHWWRFSTRNA